MKMEILHFYLIESWSVCLYLYATMAWVRYRSTWTIQMLTLELTLLTRPCLAIGVVENGIPPLLLPRVNCFWLQSISVYVWHDSMSEISLDMDDTNIVNARTHLVNSTLPCTEWNENGISPLLLTQIYWLLSATVCLYMQKTNVRVRYPSELMVVCLTFKLTFWKRLNHFEISPPLEIEDSPLLPPQIN
jgi:hypothetical protein